MLLCVPVNAAVDTCACLSVLLLLSLPVESQQPNYIMFSYEIKDFKYFEQTLEIGCVGRSVGVVVIVQCACQLIDRLQIQRCFVTQ